MSGDVNVDLGKLSKPANTLIEKISSAIGGIFRPYQMKRIANAEVEVAKIHAIGDLQIQEIQQRALTRFVQEETIKQINIESIASKAIPLLKEDSNPENIENDWLANFFDKSKLVSNEEMQTLWAEILAEEANVPGSFSKRTINLIASFDQNDARMFELFCSFCWVFPNSSDGLTHLRRNYQVIPLIYGEYDYSGKVEKDIYRQNGLMHANLRHLESIGLINFDNGHRLHLHALKKRYVLKYFGKPYEFTFEKEEENSLPLHDANLTAAGQDLYHVCNKKPIPEYVDHVIEHLKKFKISLKQLPDTQ